MTVIYHRCWEGRQSGCAGKQAWSSTMPTPHSSAWGKFCPCTCTVNLHMGPIRPRMEPAIPVSSRMTTRACVSLSDRKACGLMLRFVFFCMFVKEYWMVVHWLDIIVINIFMLMWNIPFLLVWYNVDINHIIHKWIYTKEVVTLICHSTLVFKEIHIWNWP